MAETSPSPGRLPTLHLALSRFRTQARAAVRRNPWLGAVAGSSLLVGLLIGVTSFILQSHFSALYQDGQRLSGWQNYLRLGAPWQALLPVVLAALLAMGGALRLSGTQPEPPLSLRGGESASAGELRASLRAERRVVSRAFVFMGGLVGIVASRWLVYSVLALSGNRMAGSTWVGVSIELAFWLVAGAAFWNWNRCHRLRMESWGVYDN
ncbi:MAG TPA: hypothetical protein VNH82_10295 [Candidatus Dormibacteraeota bacterium]|nr:hypothetical protein [Candidatus Dormibacteraeota bacterium]